MTIQPKGNEMNGFTNFTKKPVTIQAKQMNKDFEVETLEGTMQGHKGDYLVIGVNGEQYAVKEEIFGKTYQFVCATCNEYHDVSTIGENHHV